MPYEIASTIYDNTHTWQNAQDRVAFQRAFATGTLAERRMAQAALTANPLTPEAEIREQMTVASVPPRYGYRDEALTIDDVFGAGIPRPNIDDKPPSDYSGGNGSYTGSDRNVTVF